jgi:hypothetical protein
MGRLVQYFLILVTIYLFNSCESVNTVSQRDTIPFQVFTINNNLSVILTENETDKENYTLVLMDGCKKKETTLFADRCSPIISSVNQDTIYINYYALGNDNPSDMTALNPSSYQNTSRIGGHCLVQRYYYCLESEGLFARWEPKTQSYGWCIDSVYIKNDSVYCYEDVKHIKTIPINRFIYKRRGDKFCTFEIDSNYKNILWFYFFPTESVKHSYCEYLSSLINDH